jgi:hypothetical protein
MAALSVSASALSAISSPTPPNSQASRAPANEERPTCRVSGVRDPFKEPISHGQDSRIRFKRSPPPSSHLCGVELHPQDRHRDGIRPSERPPLCGHRARQGLRHGDSRTLHVVVTEAVSKTHEARRVPVLDARVAERLLARQSPEPQSPRHRLAGGSDDRLHRDNC